MALVKQVELRSVHKMTMTGAQDAEAVECLLEVESLARDDWNLTRSRRQDLGETIKATFSTVLPASWGKPLPKSSELRLQDGWSVQTAKLTAP